MQVCFYKAWKHHRRKTTRKNDLHRYSRQVKTSLANAVNATWIFRTDPQQDPFQCLELFQITSRAAVFDRWFPSHFLASYGKIQSYQLCMEAKATLKQCIGNIYTILTLCFSGHYVKQTKKNVSMNDSAGLINSHTVPWAFSPIY